ncbi:MAG: anthranilate phosphoribosyltransferase, partial [Pelagibacteraceae bacterium]|nr:anthranilate phosphoribosyltransferase [Pelagibacteraceae bacterium]
KFEDIVGKDADYNSKIIIDTLKGEENALLEIVSINTAAGLIVLDKFKDLEEAYEFSRKHISSSSVINYIEKLK